jgi:hypothetical protein
MARFRMLGRRVGPVGIALTAWDIWRRLPPHYRREVMALARRHGPRMAAAAAARYRRRRFRP